MKNLWLFLGMVFTSQLSLVVPVELHTHSRIRDFIDDYYPYQRDAKNNIYEEENDTASEQQQQQQDDGFRRWTSPAPLVNRTFAVPITTTTVIFDATAANGRNSTLVTTTALNATKEVQVLVSNATKQLVIAWFAPSRKSNIDSSLYDMYGFWRNAGALTLGVKRVRDENLLQNYNITLIHANGGCDPIKTIRMAGELIKTGVDVIIGPGCSGAAVPLNYYVEAQRIPHILHGAGDPELSNRQLHPNAVRPVQNYYDSGQCLRDFFANVMHWSQIAVIYQANYYPCDFWLTGMLQRDPPALLAQRSDSSSADAVVGGSKTAHNNVSQPQNRRLSVVGIHEAFTGITDREIDQILSLVSDSARVIATCFSVQTPDLLVRFMLRAKKQQMTLADGYVWLSHTSAIEDPSVPPYFPRGADQSRLPLDVALKQMNLSSIATPDDVIDAFSSLVEISWQVDMLPTFRRNVMLELSNHPMWSNWSATQSTLVDGKPTLIPSQLGKVGSLHSPHLADSVYLFARAIDLADRLSYNNNITLSVADGGNYHHNSSEMYHLMKNIDFWGESGYFALDDKGERLPSFTLRAPALSTGNDSKGLYVGEFEKKGVISCHKPTVSSLPPLKMPNINNVTLSRPTTAASCQERLQANYSNTPGVIMDWKTLDNVPPAAVPACGFHNELCLNGVSSSTTVSITIVLVAVLSVVLVVAGLGIWMRRVKRESDAQKLTWKISPGALDLEALYKNGFGTDSEARQKVSSVPVVNCEDMRAATATAKNGGIVSNIHILDGLSSSNHSCSSHITLNATNGGVEDDNDSCVTVGTELNDPIRRVSRASTTRKLGMLMFDGAVVDIYALYAPGNTGATSGTNNTHLSGALLEQLRVMKQICHENINVFVGACFEADVPFCVYHRLPKGTLADVLCNTTVEIDALFKLSFLSDVLNGLVFLHQCPAIRVYGRLRDDNVVIDSRWTAKLTCYGFLNSSSSVTGNASGASLVKRRRRRSTAAIEAFDNPAYWIEQHRYDLLLWTAPEILRARGNLLLFDVKQLQLADVYSYAIIMSEMLYMQRPYQHMHERARMIVEKLATPVRADVSYVPLRPLHPPFPVWQVNSTRHRTVTTMAAPAAHHHHHITSSSGTAAGHHQRSLESMVVATASTERESMRAFESLRQLMLRAWLDNPLERPTSVELLRSFRQAAAFREASFMDLLVNKMESYARNLEVIVRARTAELVEETKRADLLLREMLPASVLEQLKAGKSVEPEFFESTTIFFSDIVQFTRIASELNPLQVVSLLNNFCVFMDDIIARYRVYKVETIGDGYLVVSGLPARCRDHAARIARMALDMRSHVTSVALPPSAQHMPASPPSLSSSGDSSRSDSAKKQPPRRQASSAGRERKFVVAVSEEEIGAATAATGADAHCSSIRLRIGINSGPCVAGVVGLKMPRYCLFGDAVNVASRMESHGKPMCIHISESTKSELTDGRYGDEFRCEERGEIFVKGKGDMRTYWLMSKTDD